jgi:hypothetical protein
MMTPEEAKAQAELLLADLSLVAGMLSQVRGVERPPEIVLVHLVPVEVQRALAVLTKATTASQIGSDRNGCYAIESLGFAIGKVSVRTQVTYPVTFAAVTP